RSNARKKTGCSFTERKKTGFDSPCRIPHSESRTRLSTAGPHREDREVPSGAHAADDRPHDGATTRIRKVHTPARHAAGNRTAAAAAAARTAAWIAVIVV